MIFFGLWITVEHKHMHIAFMTACHGTGQIYRPHLIVLISLADHRQTEWSNCGPGIGQPSKLLGPIADHIDMVVAVSTQIAMTESCATQERDRNMCNTVT